MLLKKTNPAGQANTRQWEWIILPLLPDFLRVIL